MDAPATLAQVSEHESHLTVAAPGEGRWHSFAVFVSTPAQRLDVSFFNLRDPRPRSLPGRRFLMPFAKPGPPDDRTRNIPEIAGGNLAAGHELFKGKAACATCHGRNR